MCETNWFDLPLVKLQKKKWHLFCVKISDFFKSMCWIEYKLRKKIWFLMILFAKCKTVRVNKTLQDMFSMCETAKENKTKQKKYPCVEPSVLFVFF